MVELFGVPLRGKNWEPFMLKAFDDAVLFATLCDFDFHCRLFDGLVVVGIDKTFFAEDLVCNAVFLVGC